MSTKPHPRFRKAAVLVPLAAASAALTITAAGMGGPLAAVAEQQPATTTAQLPDGTSLPSAAIEAPASVTADQGSLADPANATQILSTASTTGIPSAALSAYQRAESVINAADTTCQLPWQLVAAIGRVESNHGRAGGNTLTDAGIATPGIYGLPLDGTNGTTLINDTDAGQYDDDTTVDRAVGPMQFIPSTWSVVGVDADGDGARNPQDINDAALGTAVYLCSGTDDLSTPEGQQASVFRYNHSQSYVDLVLSVMAAYTAGDFSTIPNSTSAAGYLAPLPSSAKTGTGAGGKTSSDKTKITDPRPSKAPVTTAPPTAAPTPAPAPATKAPAEKKPDPKPGNNGGGKAPTIPAVPLPALPSTNLPPVDQFLTGAQATLKCTNELNLGNLLPSLLTGNAAYQACFKKYTGQ